MFKPMIERLAASRAGFGSVSGPNAPMPVPAMADNPHFTEAPAGVVEPGEPESMLIVLSRLAELRPKDAATRNRLERLKAAIGPLLMEADELEKIIATEAREAAIDRHNALRKQGRKQQQLVERLAQAAQDAELALQNAVAHQAAVVGDARGLADMEREGRHLGRWASDEEIAAWQQRVAKAKARLDPASKAVAEAVQVRNQANTTLDEAQKELARLGAEEMRLRKQLAGEAYIDPELGLSVG